MLRPRQEGLTAGVKSIFLRCVFCARYRLLFIIDVRKLLPAMIADDEARAVILDRPGRREAACGHASTIARPASLAGSRFIYNVNGAAGLENSPDDLAVQVYQAAENTISEGVGGFVGASHLTPKISILWPIAGHSTSAENAKIYAGISQTGEFSMARQTDWEHMTDKQKFDFLYSWCHKLEATLDGRREVIYRTKAELQKVQKKLKGEI
jgi:hypothetical protein